MNNNPDRCSQLRTLQEQLTNQVRLLRESVRKAEQEGVGNPLETLNTIKSLEGSLYRITLELQQCPPEQSEASSPSLQPAVKVSPGDQISRLWFPDSTHHDNEDEDDNSIIDEY
jgi:hypothetical protein